MSTAFALSPSYSRGSASLTLLSSPPTTLEATDQTTDKVKLCSGQFLYNEFPSSIIIAPPLSTSTTGHSQAHQAQQRQRENYSHDGCVESLKSKMF
jgi:hypothetical protein